MKAQTGRCSSPDVRHAPAAPVIEPDDAALVSPRPARRVGCWLVLLGLAVAASACATTRAETPRERPALDVPVPPPRVITPLPAPQPPPPPPVGDLPPEGANAPARPRPQRERETTTPVKQDPKPEEPKPSEPPPPNPQPAPVPQLRIPETGDTAQSAAQIKGLIERTRVTLDKIDYRPLSDQRKKAYDDAKLFNTQADEALKANNLVFAKELADKAERLAKELQGR